MKYFFCIILCLAFIACSDNLNEYNDICIIENCKPMFTDSCHNVTKEYILKLKEAQLRITRGSYTINNNLYCIEDTASDTLLYVCDDIGGGWTIFSSDTRTPAIIAQNDSGSFNNILQNENAYAWIQAIAQDMKIIKHLKDDELNFSQKEIDDNKQFWEAISSTDEHVKNKILKTRGGELPELLIPKGHYELLYSDSYQEVYDSTYRLTTTNWSQDSPYNSYCPKKSTGAGRAPAGCAAVAAAQMLYYLHCVYWVPATAPSSAYCNGYVGGDYDWAQTNYTSSIWNTMISNGIDAAPLIADVGRRLGTIYGNTSSSVQNVDFVSNVFEPYGIECDQITYNPTTLKDYISGDRPVLLIAYHEQQNSNELVGHTFIADRYKRTRMVTENYYVWVYDTISTQILVPPVRDKVEYSYSSPVISMIGMNWGWGSDYNISDEWYSLTGDWIKDYSNYNINREMVYNFSILQ